MRLWESKIERRGFMAGLAGLAAAGPAAAALPASVPPGGEMRFKVLRNNAPIGEHHMVFTRRGDDLNVAINADFLVRVAGIPVFRYQAAATESWSGGAFTGLESKVNHNGKLFSVRASRTTGGYAVQSTKTGNYQYTGVPSLLPLTYWNKQLLTAMLLNVETGQHYPAISHSPGWNHVPTAEGGTILAQRFDLTGRLHLSLWYDQQDQWASMAFHINGEERYLKYTG